MTKRKTVLTIIKTEPDDAIADTKQDDLIMNKDAEPTVNDREVTTQDLTRILREELDRLK